VIPYVAKGAQGWELDTAVRGWHKYFQGPFRMVIIGNWTPIVEQLVKEGKAESMQIERLQAHTSEPALDIVRKMTQIIEQFRSQYKGCVWANDDMYPVNPVSLASIRVLKVLSSSLGGDINSPNYFSRAMYRTRKALEARDLPIYNYSNHLPQWFNFNSLESVLETFDCANVPHLIKSLYNNVCYPKDGCFRVNVSRPNSFKFGVYGSPDTGVIAAVRSAMESGVQFINNSNKGYSRELIDAVRERIFNQ